MIRLAFMTDQNRVIGASSEAVNQQRMALLPEGLPEAMKHLYETEYIVVGASSLGQPVQAKKQRYVLTQDAAYQLPSGFENSIVCHDYMELVHRYQFSEEDLLVVGGLKVFKLFLPYASLLDIAETDTPVPGDLVFSEWEIENFQLGSMQFWSGFRTLRYWRAGVEAN